MLACENSKDFTDQAMTQNLLIVCGLNMLINCLYLINLSFVSLMTRTQAVRFYWSRGMWFDSPMLILAVKLVKDSSNWRKKFV